MLRLTAACAVICVFILFEGSLVIPTSWLSYDQLHAQGFQYRYVVLLLAGLAEGPVTSFVAGSLIAQGVLDPFPAIGVFVFQDTVMDTGFYFIGRMARITFFARWVASFRGKTNLADRILITIEDEWREHPVRLMWIGKLAYGLSAWFIMSAGAAGLPFRKFYFYTLPVMFFQLGILMGLGYLLGTAVWKEMGWWLVVLQIIVPAILVLVLFRRLGRYVRRRFVEEK